MKTVTNKLIATIIPIIALAAVITLCSSTAHKAERRLSASVVEQQYADISSGSSSTLWNTLNGVSWR